MCDPIDGSPPGSPVPRILQARILEWVAISLSNAWNWKVKVKSLSRVRLFATAWTAAHQAPPSMGFSRQEYWSGVPSPSLNWSSRALKRINLLVEWVESKHQERSYTKSSFMTVHVKMRDAVWKNMFYSTEKSHILWQNQVGEQCSGEDKARLRFCMPRQVFFLLTRALKWCWISLS